MKFYESYIGTSKEERELMLKEINKNNIMELFNDIPNELILNEPIDISGPYSEFELLKIFKNIAAKNKSSDDIISFLGGGVRQQYIPAAVQEVISRGELYTAYTPYQPEISQGMLQLIYEYQSLTAELLGVDVVNASMYDWASALGEILLVANRITRKNKVIIANPINPNRLRVAQSYIRYRNIELIIIEDKNGKIDSDKLLNIINEETKKNKKERNIAAIYFETPSYYGTLPEYPNKIIEKAHEIDILIVVGTDPISAGILSPPGEYGADFVIGEGQMLGNPILAGGPLLGILGMKYNKKWIRQVPGRLIGKTHEMDSNRQGYCITLQTREQHIRREKATSNICSNETLTAVIAGIYLSSLGKNGIRELSQSLFNKAHYLADKLSEIENIISPKYEPFFSEFVVEFKGITHEKLEKYCIEKGVIPGKAIDGNGCLRLISVSEIHSKEDLDKFVNILKEVLK